MSKVAKREPRSVADASAKRPTFLPSTTSPSALGASLGSPRCVLKRSPSPTYSSMSRLHMRTKAPSPCQHLASSRGAAPLPPGPVAAPPASCSYHFRVRHPAPQPSSRLRGQGEESPAQPLFERKGGGGSSCALSGKISIAAPAGNMKTSKQGRGRKEWLNLQTSSGILVSEAPPASLPLKR